MLKQTSQVSRCTPPGHLNLLFLASDSVIACMYPLHPNRLIVLFFPYRVTFCVFHFLNRLLRATPTKEFPDAPLLGVMLDYPFLTLLEVDR